jgi:maleate isomerase
MTASAMSQIDYGSRLRAGVLVPSGNSVAEPELRAMLPPDVSLLVTRLALKGSSKPELMRMLDRLEAASELLADAKVDVIVFHCTAVSTFAPELADGIRARIRAASGIECFTTADAIIDALRRLKAKCVSLLTPYIGEVHDREIAFLKANGFQIDGSAHLRIDTNAEMSELTPDAILEWARDKTGPRAHACLISCTAIKSAPVIVPLEQILGIPVLTINQCVAWHLLRSIGIDGDAENYGRLFSVTARTASSPVTSRRVS